MRGIPNFCWESPDISYHWDAYALVYVFALL